jgi:hypothetical protein
MRSLVFSFRPVVLAIGLLLTVALPNMASAASTGAPFEATYTGNAAFTNATTIQSSGTGSARLLGASTTSGITVIDGADAACAGGLATTSTESLRTANRDVLVITIHYTACPVSSNVFHSTGHWEVTGGTGRFVGAAGQGTSECDVDFNAGRFVFRLTGRVALAEQNDQ